MPAPENALPLAFEDFRAGRMAEAETLCRQVLEGSPQDADAWHLLGLIALQSAQASVAVTLIERSLAIRPDVAAHYSNLGLALEQCGRSREAVAAHRRAIQLDPNSGIAHYNWGEFLQHVGMLDRAMEAYAAATRLHGTEAQSHSSLGAILARLGRLDDAVKEFRRALEIEPGNVLALRNLGTALTDMGLVDEAIEMCRRALESQRVEFECGNPGQGTKGYIARQREIMAHLHSLILFRLPFSPKVTGRQILEESQEWNRLYAEPLREEGVPHENHRSLNRELRIGFVSADFRTHVVGCNLLPLFEYRDQSKLEFFCYSDVTQRDAITREYEMYCDQWHTWRDIVGLSDEAVAEKIHADRIDILVELSMHTPGHRLLVFARKPAPIQVTYLGYCGTTGLDAIDFRLSDPYLDPEADDEGCYSERTVRLPRSYWCYRPFGDAPEVSALPALANGHVTFGCLNHFAKVSPLALDLWLEILQAVPGSRLLLNAPLGSCRERVVARANQVNVSADRIEFVEKQPWMEYMQTYGRIDIALDPFPFGGGITTCDTLWMGAPVVTLCGDTAVGGRGSSILSNAGFPEWIAHSATEYVTIARNLADSWAWLCTVRENLRDRMEASPLRDGPGFAREMGQLFRDFWRNWCA